MPRNIAQPPPYRRGMPASRRPPPRSWFARNHELLALGLIVLPALHWSFSPPKS